MRIRRKLPLLVHLMHFAHNTMGDDSLDIDLDAIIQMTRAISEAPRSMDKTQHQVRQDMSSYDYRLL